MRKVTALACALFLLVLACVTPAYAEEITSEQEEQYGYYFTAAMDTLNLYAADVVVSRQDDYVELSLGYFASRADQFSRGYAICRGIPTGTKCEQARYIVIKYCNAYGTRQLDLVWQGSMQYQEYNLDDPVTLNAEGPSLYWRYAVVDMASHEDWEGILYRLGLVIYANASTKDQGLGIAWIKFYSEDPTALYASLEEERAFTSLPSATELPTTEPPTTQPPMTEPPMTEPPEDTTVPYFEETIVEHYEGTEWETFEESRVLGGLIFEVFGDDLEFAGCQSESVGCRSGGCRSGGCNAVTGSFLAIFLLCMGIVFRKKGSP